MKSLKMFESRSTAVIWVGREVSPLDGWVMVDLDAALEHLKLLNKTDIKDLFCVNLAGLSKFFPDCQSKLVGVFGDALLEPKNLTEVSENYFASGYDIVVLSASGEISSHRANNKCKILLKRINGN